MNRKMRRSDKGPGREHPFFGGWGLVAFDLLPDLDGAMIGERAAIVR